MPPRQRNVMNTDPNPVIPPRTRQGQRKAQQDAGELDIPLQHLPVQPDTRGPEKSKKRGRPKTTDVPACIPLEGTPHMPPETGTHSGGHKSHSPPQEPSDAPPSKRKKNGTDDRSLSMKQKPSRQRLAKIVPPREPLPDRLGRNIHPVKPKATRRTAQEIAADREARIRELEEKIRVAEEAKELLAQMNVNEEHDDEQMLVDNPQRLSAAIKKYGQDLEDSEIEEFDFGTVEKGFYSDDEVVETAKKKNAKRGKSVKGELRNDIESREVKIRKMEGVVQDERRDLINKMSDATVIPSDTMPRKYRNSGLQKNRLMNREILDPFQSGGLNDEDAISIPQSFPTPYMQQLTQIQVPPTIKYPEVLQRDHSRRNKYVEIIDGNSDEVLVKGVPLKKKKLRGPGKQAANAATKLNAAEFLQDTRWAHTFIPTLSHALYVSREPFVDFTSDSSIFLAKVQEVFDLTFPNVDFKLELGDPLVNAANKRLNTRKSKIASDVLEAIKIFFQQPEFSNNPAKIKAYVRWAIGGDGPAYYKLPTPQNSKLPRDHPDYKAPEGFLESDFIVSIAARNLRYAKDSAFPIVLDSCHPPKGLYALLMAAVERGFKAFIKGTYVHPAPYSHENIWRPFRIFLGHMDRISERRWRIILKSSEADSEEDVDSDESMISAFRDDLYIPLSPQKA